MRFRPVFEVRVLAAIAFAAALLAGPLFAAPDDDTSYSKARVVRLSLVEGDVQISRPEEDDWERALANMPLQQGYALATGRGRAEVEFESGATMRIADFTEVQFNEMYLSDGNRITRITLQKGTAIFYANLARNDEFVVLTPGASVNVPRNSRFRMDVTDKHVNVSVLKGDVTIEAQRGSYKLTKNQALLLDLRGEQNGIVARAADADEFERWAADRDDAINTARSNSLHYVSAPFRYGVGDLGQHGTWIYAAGYGYVWQPWGISAGWSPYYHGRWIYSRGYGWTWVSYEPWGWLPYHYGSWAYTRHGWGWVPGSLHRRGWHPGLVVWINIGGGRHGWCPRSPFDRPGRTYHNVNIHNTVIVNTGSGIITGGRHERWNGQRDGRDWRFVDDDGPRRRDHFGNVGEIRRASGIVGGRSNRSTLATSIDSERTERRSEGRSEDRLVKGGGNIGRTPAANGFANGERNETLGTRDGNVGRRFGQDDIERRPGRTEELRKGAIATGRERPEGARVEGTRIEGARRDGENDRPRGRVGGDPNTTVEYDSQRRRYENQPSVRPREFESDARSDNDRDRLRPGSIGSRRNENSPANGGRYESTPPRSDDSRRGGYIGGRPNAEPRGRAPESRPETPRYERPRNEPRNDSGSRGGYSGRPADTPRPSSPPPRMDSPRPSGGNIGGSPSRGGSIGGGGGRPSSPPARPSQARPSGNTRRPRGSN